MAWAEQRNALIIEDDYESEFRFEGRPLHPLQTLDATGRVIYVGSFSKVMLPTLRLGFLIAPASLRAALRAAKELTDWHGEVPVHAALARCIDDGRMPVTTGCPWPRAISSGGCSGTGCAGCG